MNTAGTSRLGLGCASYWARPDFPDAQARAVLEAALDCGITRFDTGASYGDGFAEQRLGRLLRELDQDPEQLQISTKIGTVRDARGRLAKDFSPRRIADHVAASLKRLGLERVSLLLLHGPTPEMLSDELRQALEQIRARGLADQLGINAHLPTIETIVNDPQFRVLMPFLSLPEPQARAAIAAAGRAGQQVIAAGPLARMSFRPPWRDWLTRPSGRWYLARALARSPRSLLGSMFGNRALRRALEHPGWSPAQLAVAWVLEQPGVGATVFGSTRPEHVRELAEAAARPLPDPVRARLAALEPVTGT
jgi:aryl-alcohol dehydrogenase-like predicted oxidoreductase